MRVIAALGLTLLSIVPVAAQEKSGFALQYDGIDDYVRIAHADTLSGGPGKSITVEAWILPDESVTNMPIIVKWLNPHRKDWGLLLTNNQLTVSIENDGDNYEYISGEVTPGVWTHVAFTYDTNSRILRTCINGNHTGNGEYHEKGLPKTAADIVIAKRGYIDEYYKGFIDEVRIWNRARTESEIESTMKIPLTGTEQGLLAYWRFDESVGTRTTDVTKNSHDGELIAAHTQAGPQWVASTVPFIIDAAMNLLKPDGGEVLLQNSQYAIEWAADSSISDVSLDYSLDSGQTWLSIISSTANDGQHLWTVPDTVSESCFVRIYDAADVVPMDRSEGPFAMVRIAGEMDVTLTCDNEYELYVNGEFVGRDSMVFTAETYKAPVLAGENVLAVRGVTTSSPGGLLVEVRVDDHAVFVTDQTWVQNDVEKSGWFDRGFYDSNWWPAVNYGSYGMVPWSTAITGIPLDSKASWIWGDSQDATETFFRGSFFYHEDTQIGTLGPEISNTIVIGKTDHAVTIYWDTDRLSDSQILYGTDENLDFSSPVDTNLVLKHYLRIDNLLKGTSYFFKVKSKDQFGNASMSDLLNGSTEAGPFGDNWPDYSSNPFVFNTIAPIVDDLFFVEDLNGDGLKDYTFRSNEYVYAYDHFGALIWVVAFRNAHEYPGKFTRGTRHAAADVDGDGQVEIVALDGAREIMVVNGSSGEIERTITLPLVGTGNIWYHIAIANLRGFSDRDIIVQSHDVSNAVNGKAINRNLLAWDLEGNRELWRVEQDNNIANGIYEGYWGPFHGSFQCADVDMDGRDEVVGANYIDDDGTIVELGYPSDWVRASLNGYVDHLDALAIGDFRPEVPGLEWVVTEEDHNDLTDWHTTMVSASGVIWRKETNLFESRWQEPQNVAVGNFDTERRYAEVWVRSRFSGPSDSQHSWIFDAFGYEYANYASEQVLPAGFNEHEYGNKQGIEQISVIDWFGGEKKYIAAKARHFDGNIGVFDALTGGAVWFTPRDYQEVKATIIYVADVSGDHREEVIIYDKISGQIKIYWNDGISMNPGKERKWQDPLYKRQNQNWNYYSPSGYINEEPPDVTNPRISNIKVQTNLDASISISWKTDEGATSQVEYGFTSSYDSTSQIDSTFKLNHQITLTDVFVHRTYHFQALSTDGSGNLATSEDFIFFAGSGDEPLPEINSITPSASERNTEVEIRGKYLSQTKYLYFNHKYLAEFTINSDSLLTVIVPEKAKNGKIRVVTPGGSVESQEPFEILPDPGIGLVAPNGGEQWPALREHTIMWTSIGNIDTVKLEYSINQGRSWLNITDKTTNNGAYEWSIPETVSDSCLVRITGNHAWNPADTSDSIFSILPAPQLTITAPNGGETWFQPNKQLIQWTSIGKIDSIELEYSTNGGENWQAIDEKIPNNGLHEWTLPNVDSDSCLVRISHPKDHKTIDISNECFTILPIPELTITKPNGGEEWLSNSKETITWRSVGRIDSVQLEFSHDNGITWQIIKNGVTNSGAFEWSLPNIISDSCLIKIFTAEDAEPTDISDSVFVISAEPRLNITRPNGGEIWQMFSRQNIEWESVGKIDSVRLEYSLNNGQDWFSIGSKLPNTKSYHWTVPEMISDSCLIKISNVNDQKPMDISDAVFAISQISNVLDEAIVPEKFRLYDNYPNPFNPSTFIRYDLPEDIHVRIIIYDLLGRIVHTLVDKKLAGGSYTVRWDGKNSKGQLLSSGVYFYKLITEKYIKISKMLLVK